MEYPERFPGIAGCGEPLRIEGRHARGVHEGLIANGDEWMAMIQARNRSSHTYPTGPVIPSGTDRLLSDYPNMDGDLSAGSGYRAFIHDEDHARAFFARHQDKLLYGSDCSDPVGQGPACSGIQQINSVRRFSPDKKAARKILYGNARRVLKLN